MTYIMYNIILVELQTLVRWT